jgi:hypothetical protein
LPRKNPAFPAGRQFFPGREEHAGFPIDEQLPPNFYAIAAPFSDAREIPRTAGIGILVFKLELVLQVGTPLGISVHDHVIVGRGGHASLKGLGLI